jgi:SAM-dependent methyltransferase
MRTVNRTKRILREHRFSRGLYRLLAEEWTKSQIFIGERVFGRYHTARRFDCLFARTPDPWGYRGDAVAEERRDLILKTLPVQRYRRLLEVGCAAGWMTVSLASRTDDLLAVDISSVALQHAREECRPLTNVRVLKLDLLTEPIRGTFDGILCAGVLVFLPAESQQEVRDRLAAALAPGGDLILEHTVRRYPGEVAGSEIHELYRHHPQLIAIKHQEACNYAVTLFRKVPS